MKKNMSTTDRLIRLIVAAAIFTMFYLEVITGVWGYVLLVLGLVLALTSIVGFCPLYKLLGINTMGRHINPTE
jgi:hypothetical protein